MEKIRKETVYALDHVQKGLLDRLRKSKAISYDAWREGAKPVNPTQFVQIEAIGPPPGHFSPAEFQGALA